MCNPSGNLYGVQPSAPAHPLQPQQIIQGQNSNHQECSALSMPLMPCSATVPGWRCLHNNIVLPPAAPEMLITEESCCGICIQWPTVVHASAYVVEFLDQTAMVAQRLLRPTTEGVLPALMDLRVDVLQPGAYAACVRCVAPCGCESAPSSWSYLPPASAAPSTLQPQQLLSSMVPTASHICPPPPNAPPSLPVMLPPSAKTLPPILEEATTMDCGHCDEILTLD